MNLISAGTSSPGILPELYSTKRDGLTIANCDSEPVQTPGCVQAHGALLVLRLSDLRILQASENAAAIFGQSAQQLLGQQIGTVIGAEGQRRLRNLLDQESTDCTPIYLLTLPDKCSSSNGKAALDVSVHTVDGVAVLEFEATCHTLEPKPDYYALVKTTLAKLQTSSSLQQFCDVVVNDIRALTGLDRVMVYKFHDDGHGEVLAESRRADIPSWLGLHYPAEDIPKPARAIFTKTWIRPVSDVAGPLAELVPLANPDTLKPLNMTYCVLRGVSIMYTEYLRNMGVTAALTMAIRRNDKLWGLIACHHYEGPQHIPQHIRAACEFLAQIVSLQQQATEEKEYLAYRLKIEGAHQVLLAVAARDGGLAGLINGTQSLLNGIDAGGAALYYLDRWWCIGNTPTDDQLTELGEWLTVTMLPSCPRPLYATDRLAQEYPPAARFADVGSGLLAVPVSANRRDLMLWFRPETIQTVNWGGNPHDKPTVLGPNGPRLTPRHSFELFTESVLQQSLPWRLVEIDAAAGLRFLVAELVAGQSGQRTVLHADLARSNEDLDAFVYIASHDLKEPLRGIYRYAHQLRDDFASMIDDESRRKLDGLVRLSVRMDGLLDSMLHFSRVGGTDLLIEEVNLNESLADALDSLGSRTIDDKNAVTVPRQLPTVQCDRIRCRQILVNLLSNGLKYSDVASRHVEVGYIGADEIHARPGCPSDMQGQAIYYVADNGIGIQAKHYNHIFKLFKRLHGHDGYGGGSGAGLTIVRKLVEQHGGQVWVDSLAGQGSTFYFTLPGRASVIQ
ncbi:ATP-binding protein [Massilia sp. TWR1-2-2]|uniref:ATP-binding protein n=1 Tax=Massilia sp. TWR1-2-2 TaxID=2804584 RepID=UPI003CE724AA